MAKGVDAPLGHTIIALLHHFCSSAATQADTVEVRWPDGAVTQVPNVKAGQVLKIGQP